MVTGRPRKLYVEGGGDNNSALASECRKAFSKLFERAGIERKPRVVACGARKRAYDQFCTAHAEAEADVWLLVDAEDLVACGPPFDPWSFVKTRSGDAWHRPKGATDEQLHFMSVVMETWLIADHAALRKVFGPRLDVSKLPPEDGSLETKNKQAIYAALAAATKPTPSGEYGKGVHSFRVLAEVSPEKLRPLSWANRFLDKMGSNS